MRARVHVRISQAMQNFLLACAGGALGAGARYLVGVGALRALGPSWPVATLGVNLVGGLAMGLLVGWLAHGAATGAATGAIEAQGAQGVQAQRVFLGVGVLGGFTTFSAFSLEMVLMLERRQHAEAAAYALVSVIGSVGAVLLGLWCARRLFAGAGA